MGSYKDIVRFGILGYRYETESYESYNLTNGTGKLIPLHSNT